MSQGVQNELRYAHNDHSFSAFGNSDSSGSSWLTAFVARVFIQAKPFTTIDENVIINALTWLKGQQVGKLTTQNLVGIWTNRFLSLQQPEGYFKEPGNICHKDMQGEASKGVALTAYIIVSFLIDPVNIN